MRGRAPGLVCAATGRSVEELEDLVGQVPCATASALMEVAAARTGMGPWRPQPRPWRPRGRWLRPRDRRRQRSSAVACRRWHSACAPRGASPPHLSHPGLYWLPACFICPTAWASATRVCASRTHASVSKPLLGGRMIRPGSPLQFPRRFIILLNSASTTSARTVSNPKTL
jgi:hypothetical protein